MTFKHVDVSEFQPNCDWAAYLGAGYNITVYRAYNGYRPDFTMPARRDDIRSRAFVGVGIYAFLVSDVDPAVQAKQFIASVGQLAPHEFPILDAEEVPWHPWTPGQERRFADIWFSIVDPWFGHKAMLYSDYNTLDLMGGRTSFGDRPLWPAHPGGEPSFPHIDWQYGYDNFPGCPNQSDASQSSGLDPGGFMAAIFGGAAPTPAPPPPPPVNPPPATRPGTGTFRLVHPTLAVGATGAAVMHLQILVGAGPDGRFGNMTRQSVINAQNRNGLQPDGVCGPQTWSRIHPVTQQGSTGDTVREVQAEVGVGVDGNDGPMTTEAVHEYQRFYALGDDGQAGPATFLNMMTRQ